MIRCWSTPATPGCATFVRAAEDARTHQRLADARGLVESRAPIDPQSAELAREAATIGTETVRGRGLGGQFAAAGGNPGAQGQALAAIRRRDVAGASATANALRRVLAGSVYVSTELPQKLVAAYAHAARSQLLAGSVDPALQTIAAGRQKFGSAPSSRISSSAHRRRGCL